MSFFDVFGRLNFLTFEQFSMYSKFLHQIHSLPSVRRRNFHHVARKYGLNESFLDDCLTTEKHQWFWGFFMTDGHIYYRHGRPGGIGFYDLRYDSFNILYFLRDAINSDHPIFFDRKKDGIYGCTLELHSTHLGKQALKLAQCRKGKKAFDIQYPSSTICSTNDHSNVVLGIFDGDGTLKRNGRKTSTMVYEITSSSKLLLQGIHEKIQDGLPTLASNGSITSVKTLHRLKYCTRSDILAIGDWMYSSIPDDWNSVHCNPAGNDESISMISQYLVPYHRKKYLRYQWFQKIHNETPAKRAEAIEQLINEEKQLDDEILTILRKMSLELIPKPDCFRFRRRFVEDAERNIGFNAEIS